MLSYRQEIELIRQAEKANMTVEEEEALKKWAIQTNLNKVILELIFDGCVDVETMVAEPSLTLTEKGEMVAGTDDIDEVIEAILSADPDAEDHWDEDYDDFDEEEVDEGMEVEEVDAVMSLGKSAEEIKLKMQVLQSLCHKMGIETE